MKNVIIDKPFDLETVDRIKSIIADSDRHEYQEAYSQRITNFRLPDDISKRIVELVEDAIEESGLELLEYQFARYTVSEQDTNLPNLKPHFDDVFPSQRFTFDYQLDGNTTWPLVVEDKEFELQNNQALMFSGTNQIHWRTHKEFGPGEYVDMIFCHLGRKEPVPFDPDHNAIMVSKQIEYVQKWKQEK